MRVLDIARRARRSLTQAKARTILTSLAIGVGAFTITLSLAAGVGGKEYAQSIVKSNVNEKQIMVTKVSKEVEGPTEYSPSGKTSIDMGPGGKIDTLNNEDVEAVRKVLHVATAYPTLSTTPLYITTPGDAKKKYELPMMDVYDAAIKHKYAAGQPGSEIADGAVISDEYRKALGFASAQEAIGSTIQVVIVKGGVSIPDVPQKAFSFVVRGVTDKNATTAAITAPVLVGQESLIAMHNYQYEGTAYDDNYMAIYANVDNASNVESVKQALNDKGYKAESAEDIMQFIFQFINVLQGILLGFGALAVLTAIFGIINTQYISVLERTQQIGLMKALGMRRRDVGRLFKFEAAWIGFLGGAIGSGLAYVAGLVGNPYITKALTLDEGTNLLLFPVWIFATVIVGLMIVSVTAGILPARKASKLDPIEALRTE
jgi:putative ABC transport system permease protein